MYKRFFAFGCSYTSFVLPTWADILAHDLEIESYNYGIAGLGNVGVMHEIVKADLIHKFNEEDLIIVVWSHWNREDRWIGGRWAGFGSIFNNPAYDKKFIKKYWTLSNDIIKNATAILSTNKMLGKQLVFQGHIMEPATPEANNIIIDNSSQELLDFYMPHIPKTGIFENNNHYSFDGHPTIKAYINYTNTNIMPVLGKDKLKKSTTKHFLKIDNEIHKIASLPISDDEKMYKSKIYYETIKKSTGR